VWLQRPETIKELQRSREIKLAANLVQRNAYIEWVRRKRPLGQDVEIWLEAERAVKSELSEHARRLIEYQPGTEIAETLGVPVEATRIILPSPAPILIQPYKSIITEVVRGSRSLDGLHWREFETLMADILKETGWIVEPMGGTKDGGIDIVAVCSVAPDISTRMLVQCKRYAAQRPVEISVVREVWAVKWQHGFHHAMIATTSRFTSGAKHQAQEWDLHLKDNAQVLDWCRKIEDGELRHRES
jgi:HJR/Mrr/RecB family endonuclease